jgi:rubrerythrin
MECLNIESFEHCYFIPVLAQTAEYWGDAQVASACNLMSRQVKQYFNHAAHVHCYMSKKNSDIKHDFCLHDTYKNFSTNMQLESKQEDYHYYQSNNQNFHISNDINNTLNLSNAPSVFLHTYADADGPFGSRVPMIPMPMVPMVGGVLNSGKRQENSFLKSLHEIDQNLLQMLARIGENLETNKIPQHVPTTLFPTNIRFVNDDDCFLLLKILRLRKIWKATRWYPLVSKLASNQRMLHVSRSFMRISKSEKDVSTLLMQLMHR